MSLSKFIGDPEEADIPSPLFSSGTFNQLEKFIAEDEIELTPRTFANGFPSQGTESQALNLSTNEKSKESNEECSKTQATIKNEVNILEENSVIPKNLKLNVSYKEPTKVTKMMLCSYLASTNTLYVKHMTPCTTIIRVEGNVPKGCQLHLSPFFNHSLEPVRNCPFHAKHGHLIRIDTSLEYFPLHNVTYHYHNEHQCTSLLLSPFPKEQSTPLELLLPVVYTCRSSCQGGIHKRPFHVSYSLSIADEKLAQTSVNTWVGDCPGRARRNAEERLLNKDQDHNNNNQNNHSKNNNNNANGNNYTKLTNSSVTDVESKDTLAEDKVMDLCSRDLKDEVKFSNKSFSRSNSKRKLENETKENKEEYKICMDTYEEWKWCNRFKNLLRRHSEEGCVCRQDVCILRLIQNNYL